MTKHLLFFGLIFFTHPFLFAQLLKDEEVYIHHKSNNANYAKTESTGNSGTGTNINVIYQRCKWAADPDDATRTLTGDVTMVFKTIEANVNSINLDLKKASFNNAFLIVTYHNQNCSYSFPTTGYVDVLQINLPSPILSINTTDSVTIKYKGTPPIPSGNLGGYYRATDNASNNYLYTLSESYEDKDWWPCKADMQDKIDSIDIEVTVPQAFWVASNGKMIDSSIVGANRIFKFKHRYPIASYLVSLGIAKYKKWYLGNFTNGADTYPYIVNIFPDKTAATESSMLGFLNNHKLVLDVFNNKFGTYPFAKEKHGFYEFGFGGGMEHQTFSGIGGSSFLGNSVLAHELGHQWWGDKVTMQTWTDLWLAEGFATYSEMIAAEFVPSLGINLINKIGNTKTSARNNTSTSVAISDITNSTIIWGSNNVSAMYNRGCMVVSMLRTIMGDTKFFTACRNYLNHPSYAYASANTNNLQTVFENVYGSSLSNFFGEWIYKKGTPNYTIQWGNNSNSITLQFTQTVTSSGSIGTASSFFPMPLIVKVSNTNTGKDTTLIMYHSSANSISVVGNTAGVYTNNNRITFQLPFTPNAVSFDAENKTMATASITYNAALPNNNFLIEGSIKNEELTITGSCQIDTKHIQLQYSINGIDFLPLAAVLFHNQTFTWQGKQPTESTFFVRAFAQLPTHKMYSNTILLKLHTKNDFSITPNPASSFISINKLEGLNNTTIIIRNSIGQIVKNLKPTNLSLLNVSELPKGYYFIELWQKEKWLNRKGFVKL